MIPLDRRAAIDKVLDMVMVRELDISPEYCHLPTAEDLACVGRNFYRRIWVGGTYSPFDVVEEYLTAIERAGVGSGVYGFLHWDDSAKARLDKALSHVIADRRRRFMLDVELGDPYSMDPTFVLGRYEWAVAYCRAAGVEPITYCVAADTRILTDDLRWVRAGDLVEGNGLMAFEESLPARGQRRPRRFQHASVISNRVIRAKIWEIALGDGTVLTATPEHRWLLRTSTGIFKWVRTDALPAHLDHPQRKSALMLPRFVRPWSIERDYDAGFLAAAFDGEGCLTRHHIGTWPHLSFIQKQNGMLDSVRDMLSRKGFQFTEERRSQQDGCHVLHVCGGHQATLEFLGRFQPPRQLTRWANAGVMEHELSAIEQVEIISAKSAGIGEIAELSSSSGTYIAEGFGAHNTGPWWWPVATNDSQETLGTMAILAEYVHDPDVPPALDTIKKCGGWSIAADNLYGWQYAGTVDTCELNTDRILVIKEATVAFDALKRATQDQAVRQLAGDALNDDMTRLVARLAYFGILPPGTTALRPAIVTETRP